MGRFDLSGPNGNTTRSVITELQKIMGGGGRDAEAEELWFKLDARFRPILAKWCERLGLFGDDAEEVVQQTMLKLSLGRGLEGYNVDEPFRAWLRTVQRNCAHDARRKATRRPGDTPVGGTDAQQAIEHAEDPRTKAGRTSDGVDEKAEAVLRAVEEARAYFEAKTYEAFRRVVIEGETLQEVAASMGIKPESVGVLVRRFSTRVREIIEENGRSPQPVRAAA